MQYGAEELLVVDVMVLLKMGVVWWGRGRGLVEVMVGVGAWGRDRFVNSLGLVVMVVVGT